MPQATTAQNPGIRVVLHITPATYVASILAAQRRDQKLNEFLDGAIGMACADGDDSPDRLLPWGTHAMDLFLQLADTVPEALRGQWQVLYAKVLNEPGLWTVPETSLGDFESGVPTPDWHINAAALRKAWPRLVSSTFLC